MGAEYGFDCVKKFKDISMKDFRLVNTYIYWKENPWNTKPNEVTGEAPYPTFEKFWKSNCYPNEVDEYPGEPDIEAVEFYQKNKEGEFGSIPRSIQYWCSVGRYIDDYCVDTLHPCDTDNYCYEGITKEWIDNALRWVTEKIEENKLIPVKVIHGYKYINKDEEKNILLTKIDGIEIEDEEGNVRRIWTSDPDCYDDVYVSKNKYFDSEELDVYNSFRETLFKLKDIDLENNLVWYYRSF